jgi:CheY-like chemotaxis protein/DNA-binding XRE family transcriptional regulator
MDIEKVFGASVRKWREKARLSQEELAKKAGLHRTYICDIERGARNVSLKNIKRISDALPVPLTALLGDLADKPATAPRTHDEMVDILVVEDNPDDLHATLEVLKSGHITNRTYVVKDGEAALNFLFGTGPFAHRHSGDQPQIVLLDLNLPKIDGIDVLRRIKADPRTASISVIALTGSRAARDIAECKRLGVQDYISKPVTFESFSEVSLKLNLQWALLKPNTSAAR